MKQTIDKKKHCPIFTLGLMINKDLIIDTGCRGEECAWHGGCPNPNTKRQRQGLRQNKDDISRQSNQSVVSNFQEMQNQAGEQCLYGLHEELKSLPEYLNFERITLLTQLNRNKRQAAQKIEEDERETSKGARSILLTQLDRNKRQAAEEIIFKQREEAERMAQIEPLDTDS